MKILQLTILLVLLCVSFGSGYRRVHTPEYHSGYHQSSRAPYIRQQANITPQLQEIAGWKYLTFKDDGISENALFTGVTHVNDKLYISVPRFREGVPASLTYLPINPENLNLNPYPENVSQNGDKNQCDGFVSVFRTRVDSCNRLWAVDSGAVLNGPGQGCGPKLIVTNLNTNYVERVVIIPNELLTPTSMLSFIAFDTLNQRSCDDMLVYIADARGFGLIVYDVKNGSIWRFNHESMQHKKETSTYTIAGETAQTKDGINSMAISNNGTHRLLYFHGLSDRSLYAVPTSELREPDSELHVSKVLDKTSPAVALTADSNGILYYVPVAETSLVTFDPRTGVERTLLTDSQRLQFVSDITVDTRGDLWLVSNRFQSFASGTYGNQAINLRILRLSRPK